MKRSEFDERFDALLEKMNQPVSTQEGVLKMLESYTKDVNKITLYEMFNVLFIESRKYTNDITYQLFSEFLDVED